MSSKGEEEIDIDDPDFWQKWAKKAELDVDLMNKVGHVQICVLPSRLGALWLLKEDDFTVVFKKVNSGNVRERDPGHPLKFTPLLSVLIQMKNELSSH